MFAVRSCYWRQLCIQSMFFAHHTSHRPIIDCALEKKGFVTLICDTIICLVLSLLWYRSYMWHTWYDWMFVWQIQCLQRKILIILAGKCLWLTFLCLKPIYNSSSENLPMKNRDEQRYTAAVIYEMEIDLAAMMNTVMRSFTIQWPFLWQG